MRRLWFASVLASFAIAFSAPVDACMMEAPLLPADVRFANVVVVGRITNYQIVLDQEFRRKGGYTDPEVMTKPAFMTDYARFEMSVDEVLKGDAPKTLTVTWDNSTFAEPETMAPGPWLIALRKPGTNMPPLRGPSATISANPEPDVLTLLQAPCAPAFILPSDSKEAKAVRKILAARPK
jgi:hypothetical protein